MKPSLLKETLKACIDSHVPVFISGSPGIGKSALVRELCDDLGKKMTDVRALLHDPVDFSGLPHVAKDEKTGKSYLEWLAPNFFPKEPNSLIFLDEINAAAPSVQASLYQLVLDRKLGSYVMPDDCVVFAAGNKDTDKAVTHRMPTPLANRFMHIDFEIDRDEWVQWAYKNQILTEIISYILFRGEHLFAFDPKSKERAFASPRSWEMLSRMIKSLRKNPATKKNGAISAAAIGCIGAAIGTEFTGFLRICDNLPDIAMILQNPKTADIPTDASTRYALCGSLSDRADKNNLQAIIDYTERMGNELSVLTVHNAMLRIGKKEMGQWASFTNWAVNNHDLII